MAVGKQLLRLTLQVMDGEVKELWVGSKIIWKEAASTVLP